MKNIIKKQTSISTQLSAFSHALADLEELYQDMTLRQMRVFIAIASQQPITSTEVASSLSLGKPTVCRSVQLLCFGMSNRRKASGLDLVEIQADPEDKRRQTLKLTQSGRLLSKLLCIRLFEATKA